VAILQLASEKLRAGRRCPRADRVADGDRDVLMTPWRAVFSTF
jgi:hypothetical protein